MKIIDNFLPEEEFKSIQSIMMGEKFPWYVCTTGMVEMGDGGYQFCHMFYEPIEEAGITSDYLEMWKNFSKKIGTKNGFFRIKANLTTKTTAHEESLFHRDLIFIDEDKLVHPKTAIFYINTNNGYTEFKNGVIVNSVANRVCIFDTTLEHRGVTHTKGHPARVVMNFNYE